MKKVMNISEAAVNYLIQRYSEKVKELMTEEEYTAWSVDVAKGMLFVDLEACPDSDFKDFVLKYWEKITNDTNNNNTGL